MFKKLFKKYCVKLEIADFSKTSGREVQQEMNNREG